MSRLAIQSTLAAAICCACGTVGQTNAQPPTPAVTPAAGALEAAAQQVSASLDKLDAWLGDGENGKTWDAYLRLAPLRVELVKGALADPAVIVRTLQQFQTGAAGLELQPFAELRDGISAWATQLKLQFKTDLSKLAWASRGDFTPITDAEFNAIHGNLRTAAAQLQQALGPGTPLAQGWNDYLKLEYLEPHLDPGFVPDRRNLAQLDDVRRRIHSNRPGLELPPFVALANALEKYRAVVAWHGGDRDRRADYERLMLTLQEELRRHDEKPTTETAWQIARILKIVDGLGRSPELMAAVVDRYGQSNASVQLSATLIRRLPNRPLDGQRDVKDNILGTQIKGYADVVGGVEYGLRPSDEGAQLAVLVHGGAESHTNGYNDPVKLTMAGHTDFGAEKLLAIQPAAFTSAPSVAWVDTSTRVTSICKTGGRFAHKLIEKIAWKRAGEQKAQSEHVSELHTKARIEKEFDKTTAEQLAIGRTRYEEKVAKPLIRRGYPPEIITWRSTDDRVLIESIFGVAGELEAASQPPTLQAGQDITVQIHESTINNFLPVALATATIAQEAAGVPPSIKGNAPPWLKLLTIAKPEAAGAAARGAQALEAGKAAVDAVQETVDQQGGPKKEAPLFRPWSITLNSEAPAAVRFDDNKLTLRIRAAQLVSEDDQFENWDFIVTYAITHTDNKILLKRVGDIEVFPTGFDPEWDRRMSTQQSGFRSTLAKNMNARAKSGQGFPSEIPIQPISISRFGTLVLSELSAKGGWLTVAWKLP